MHESAAGLGQTGMVHEPEELCVLTFHRIVDARKRDHDVTWSSFFRLVDDLRYETTTEFLLAASGGRRVVLTFDDGTVDHLEVGRALAERHVRAIFFVPAAIIGEEGFLSGEHLRELRDHGHVIGSHGFAHTPLDRLSPAEVALAVRRSKDALESVLSAPIRYFAPPGGRKHASLRDELERNGFTASRSMRWGLHRDPSERWRIPCIPVTELTIGHGWIRHALSTWSLPWTMRVAGSVKAALPESARAALRARVHR